MKLLLPLTLLLSLSSFQAVADEKPATDPKMQEMMSKMKEYSTPGEPHKTLASMAGSWTYTSKWWPTADAKPEESKGTSKIKMIMGGRYLQHETKGMAMGQPFEGMGLTAYDNIKKKYETIWLDNMGTGIALGSGDFDAATKTLVDNGQFSCPMTKDQTAEYRGEWKIVDKNNMIYSMFGKGIQDEGPEFKTMEMIFKRKK